MKKSVVIMEFGSEKFGIVHFLIDLLNNFVFNALGVYRKD